MATLGMTEDERAAVARFQQEVIEPSQTHLLLLDFWAAWCGPCKQLAPVLEKIAADYEARGVKLVKIDVDEDKLIAAQFRIQSIPTVYAFFQGQPVADISSYRTEAQLRQAIDHLLAQLPVTAASPPQAEIGPLIAMGEEAIAAGDSERAVAIFRQVFDLAPDDPQAIGGLARALLKNGDPSQASALVEGAAPEVAAHPAVARARAAIDLAGRGADDKRESELRQRIAANPDDHEARIALADARLADGDRDEAADILLESIDRDKDWDGGAARQRFLQMLEAQGLEDPWGRAQRRRLSALLFT